MRRAARHDRAPEVKGPKIQFTERKEKDSVFMKGFAAS